jgi:hypothetical protein
MKKFKLFITAIMLLTACSKESTDSMAPASSSTPTTKTPGPRSFYATINAVVDVNSPNPPTACSGDAPFVAPDFLLNGEADHMGNIRATLHHDACNLSLAGIPMLLTTDVSGQMVAANGDLITYTGDDIVDVTNFVTGAGSTGPITGTWTITGGTGRFEGATGSFTINGTVDFQANTFSAECVGTIIY